MAKVLILPLPEDGHVNPTIPIARELMGRGEEVMYCLPDQFKAAVQSTGASFLPSPLPDLRGFRQPRIEGSDLFFWVPLHAALASLQLVPPLSESVQIAQPDYLIYDAWCLWGRLLAHLLHLPAIRFTLPFVLNEQLGAPFAALLEQSRRVFVTPHAWTPWAGNAQQITYQTAIEHLCATYHLPPIELKSFFDHAEALNLVPIFPAFQPGVETFGERFHFVVPNMGKRQEGTDFPREVLKAQPLLYISLGTLHYDWAEAFFKLCFAAFGTADSTKCAPLGERPWQVILSTGTRDPASLGPPPENFLVRRSVPQLEVLAHTRVFLTQGGMSSVMEALSYGVPLVVLPQSSEQAIVAGRVEELGLGISLQKADVTIERLAEAVTLLASNQEVHARCHQMRDAQERGGGSSRAVDAILQFSRTRGARGWSWPSRPTRKPKVFGIGLSRTGTTSLTDALRLLGYSAVHFPQDNVTRAEVYRFLACRPASVSLSVLQEADALTDTPVCCLYQALDQAYPGSKFILTVREKPAWLRSCRNFWQRERDLEASATPDNPIVQYRRVTEKHLYGTPDYEAEGFEAAYDRYTAEVRGYFRDRPGDLLILDICGGQGWNELAPFLGLAIPQIPFPWEKQGESKRKEVQLPFLSQEARLR